MARADKVESESDGCPCDFHLWCAFLETFIITQRTQKGSRISNLGLYSVRVSRYPRGTQHPAHTQQAPAVLIDAQQYGMH